jgi:hypothetical protein
MSVAARADASGKTRTCPHCKATILESLTICPGCLHHLRFDQEAAKRQVAAASALRVEGVLAHPATAAEPWEYFVVIAVRNERGEEVARQVVNVGVLRNAEKRTFALSVEVMSQQSVVASNKPVAPQPSAPAARAPAPKAPPGVIAKPSPGGAIPQGAAGKAMPGRATAAPGATLRPGTGATVPGGAPGKPGPGIPPPFKR